MLVVYALAWIAGCGDASAPSSAAPAAAPTAQSGTDAAPGHTTVIASRGRIVAIGDVHGDPEGARAALAVAGVVDAAGTWTGGDTTLVMTGDMADRGPDTRSVFALVRRLQSEAAAAGGQVVPLLGNHEVMNVQGDWRYVSDDDLAGYGGTDARKAALTATGEDGRWLATLGAVARVDDVAFAHGGISAAWAVRGTDAINALVADALFTDPKAAVLGQDGPLWWRGLVEEPESTICGDLDRALAALGARRMVVGHTRREDGRIESRCDGKLDVIDIGLGITYGRNTGAWVQDHGDAKALYPVPAGIATLDLPDPP
jgi:3',5'-cyclic AMP phosphodiesterase CpdA